MATIRTPARTPAIHHRLTGEQVCCPKCFRRQIYFRKGTQDWFCRLCGITVKEPAKLVVVPGEFS